MDLPGDDLATVEIQDLVEIIEQTTGRTWQPRDVLAFDLIRAGGTMTTRGLELGFLATPSVVLPIRFPQDPVRSDWVAVLR